MLTEPNGMPRGPQTPPFDGYFPLEKQAASRGPRTLPLSAPPTLSPPATDTPATPRRR